MNMDILNGALEAVRGGLPPVQPAWALVLGSGWSEVAQAFSPVASVAYSDIPGLGRTQVEGHRGRLMLGEIAGTHVLVFQGRRHFYEGTGWETVASPVYVSLKLGASGVLLTNAAGGIRAGLEPGMLMVIDDHINAMGDNPLSHGHDPVWGPRFPDQTTLYDPGLRDALDASAGSAAVNVQHGVYLAARGPAYETPAEIRAFRSMGADAVGMSTVPEAMLAGAAGMRVAGISCITNLAAGTGRPPLSHDEVVEATRQAGPAMAGLIAEFFKEMVHRDAASRP